MLITEGFLQLLWGYRYATTREGNAKSVVAITAISATDKDEAFSQFQIEVKGDFQGGLYETQLHVVVKPSVASSELIVVKQLGNLDQR